MPPVQLLPETVNGELVNSMECDNYGNIVKKNDKIYTYGDTAWKDRLTSFDGQTIEYDAPAPLLTTLVIRWLGKRNVTSNPLTTIPIPTMPMVSEQAKKILL